MVPKQPLGWLKAQEVLQGAECEHFGSLGPVAEILGADTIQSSGPSTAQGLRDQGEQDQDPGKEPEWQSTEQQRPQAPQMGNYCHCCYYCNYNNINSHSWLPLHHRWHHRHCHCSGKVTPQGRKRLSQCPCNLSLSEGSHSSLPLPPGARDCSVSESSPALRSIACRCPDGRGQMGLDTSWQLQSSLLIPGLCLFPTSVPARDQLTLSPEPGVLSFGVQPERVPLLKTLPLPGRMPCSWDRPTWLCSSPPTPEKATINGGIVRELRVGAASRSGLWAAEGQGLPWDSSLVPAPLWPELALPES